jgi:inositol phosphorylceramide synthase regulatory subunit
MNKLSGLYGIIALITGYDLSSLQLSMYVYSVFALVLTIYLGQHIKTQSPLQCLALAWFYALDTVLNAAWTAAFAVSWFLVLVAHNAGQLVKGGPKGTMGDTAGFTSPQVNASSVTVAADGVTPPAPATEAVVGVVEADKPAGVDAHSNGGVAGAVLSPESMNSIGIIIALWTVRVYFCIIMLGWARMVIRQHIAKNASQNYESASKDQSMGENPFDESKAEGQGWKGKLGRFLIGLGRSYWLGKDEDDAWMYGMKFRRSNETGTVLSSAEPIGLVERERRRRSGTGPPQPAIELQQPSADPKALQVPASNV